MNHEHEQAQARPTLGAASGSATYCHGWSITVQADSLEGAMDAVWACWQAWQKGAEPLGGICPASMGNRMEYRVEKAKSPNSGMNDSKSQYPVGNTPPKAEESQ